MISAQETLVQILRRCRLLDLDIADPNTASTARRWKRVESEALRSAIAQLIRDPIYALALPIAETIVDGLLPITESKS